MSLKSLPPLNEDSTTAVEERQIAREVYEFAVLLCIKTEDKESFERYSSCLRPYYCADVTVTDIRSIILALRLLYLLVENKLSEFHCEVTICDLLFKFIPF